MTKDPTQPDPSTLPGDIRREIDDALSLPDTERSESLASIYQSHPDHEEAIRKCLRTLGFTSEAEQGEGHRTASGLDPDEGTDLSARYRSLVDKLRNVSSTRYSLRGEIARGGMGAILRVYDEGLERDLAMKVILGSDEPSTMADVSTVDPRVLTRFLDEAQITGQLDHPGVVPVHELGIDHEGKAYFTMRLIRGRDLREVFGMVREGADGWNQTRALGVLLKACEAIAYTHDKGVIHRDLKPSNIMVGRFGEVYVMDWGLAKAQGREDNKDIRLDVSVTTTGHSLRTRRRQEAEETPDSPLITMDGDVVGTPSYMSLEQARGEVESVGPRSDVYSMGAILYQLLGGRPPYVPEGQRISPRTILAALLAAPPEPLHQVNPRVSPALAAICDKAMARDAASRYPTMQALSDELRAYLEGRVVQAHRTGAIVELQKWVQRNRTAAAALAVGVLAIVAGSLLYTRSEQLRIAAVERALAGHVARQLVARAEAGLGPIHPDHAAPRRRWLDEVREVLVHESAMRAQLGDVRAQASPYTDEERRADRTLHPSAADLDRVEKLLAEWDPDIDTLRARLKAPETGDTARRSAEHEVRLHDWHAARRDRLREEVERRRTWTFADASLRRRHDQLAAFVAQLDTLKAVEHGLVHRVQTEIELAESLAGRSTEKWRDDWSRAREAIRGSSKYGGLDLEPQLGLAPLGENPSTGLWEFWHVLSGDKPQRRTDGHFEIEPDTAIVFVLVPGGATRMGSSTDPNDPRHDPESRRNEQPVRAVELAPFFMAKYEMTQGQWVRATGTNPSAVYAGASFEGLARITGDHPIESVSWIEAHRIMTRLHLSLPTEAQVEYATRAGTDTPHWWAGVDGVDEQGIVYFRPDGGFHRPVDSGPANGFGLFHVTGNVWELCIDWYADSLADVPLQPATGQIEAKLHRHKALRGGSFSNRKGDARSARRSNVLPEDRRRYLGVRPSRRVEGPRGGG